MARTELIVGGDFETPGVSGQNFQLFSSYGSWSGNDMEVWYESSYVSNGSSSNTILELDGSTDPANITSLAQTFSVDKDNESALLSFDLSARSHNTGVVKWLRILF